MIIIPTLSPSSVPTPGAGKIALSAHSTDKRAWYKDDSGRSYTLPGIIKNQNTADVVANAADTYLTGSNLVVPVGLSLQVGTTFKWRMYVTKTGAGVAAPVWVVHIGTGGTTADAAILTFTSVAQTANVDVGYVEIMGVLRNVGAAGVIAGGLILAHNGGTLGFANVAQGVTLQVTSAGFVTTTSNLIVGVSVNPGSLGVWTHQVIEAEMGNI